MSRPNKLYGKTVSELEGGIEELTRNSVKKIYKPDQRAAKRID